MYIKSQQETCSNLPSFAKKGVKKPLFQGFKSQQQSGGIFSKYLLPPSLFVLYHSLYIGNNTNLYPFRKSIIPLLPYLSYIFCNPLLRILPYPISLSCPFIPFRITFETLTHVMICIRFAKKMSELSNEHPK